MNYQKVDAALAAALAEVRELEAAILVVFVQTEPNLEPTALSVLERLGVSNVSRDRHLYTATLSANAVAELTEQAWVRLIRLSQKLRLA